MLFYHFSIEMTALILASYTCRRKHRRIHSRETHTDHDHDVDDDDHDDDDDDDDDGQYIVSVCVLANVDVPIRCDAKVYTIL